MHILGYLTEGLSNKEISHTVNLAEETVKVHIASIFQALRVNKRTQAAQIARELGLV
jgi:two-component system nitrate/nitrite response regulator NarL